MLFIACISNKVQDILLPQGLVGFLILNSLHISYISYTKEEPAKYLSMPLTSLD